jgi:hypothetical protein
MSSLQHLLVLPWFDEYWHSTLLRNNLDDAQNVRRSRLAKWNASRDHQISTLLRHPELDSDPGRLLDHIVEGPDLGGGVNVGSIRILGAHA